MERQELEQLVDDYQRLFYKVLRRCGIFPGHREFDDYLQELRLRFFLRAQGYDSRGHFEAENSVTYLFKYFLWYIIDEKRHYAPDVQEFQEELAMKVEEKRFEEVEMLDAMQQFYCQLKPKEQKKLTALLEDYQLSRQTRSRYRAYFRKKFNLFFKKR